MNAGVHGLHQEVFVQKVLNLERQVTKNHWQREAFQVTGAGVQFVPFALRVVNFWKDDVKSLLSYFGILLIACC